MDGKPTPKLPAEFSWNKQVEKGALWGLFGILCLFPGFGALVELGHVMGGGTFRWITIGTMVLVFDLPLAALLGIALIWSRRVNDFGQTYRVSEDGIEGIRDSNQLWQIKWEELSGAYGRKLHCSDGRRHEVRLNEIKPGFWKLVLAESKRRHPEAVEAWEEEKRKRFRRYAFVSYPLCAVVIGMAAGLLAGLRCGAAFGFATAALTVTLLLGMHVLLWTLVLVRSGIQNRLGRNRQPRP